MIAIVNRLLNRLRKLKRKWTTQKDREFHDQLFAEQHHNPFAFSYSGYVTIRRFADLAAPYVEPAKSVLDLGCGPAEITCELARRFPRVSFLGVDHSRRGIERAESNARTLNLKNIEFAVAAIEEFTADRKFDIILMFDSFHHLADPRHLLERLRGSVRQFLLIEPRGDWKGSHVKDLDFDWIMADLENMRLRIAAKIPEAATSAPSRIPAERTENSAAQAKALENRYNLEEFRKIFKGFGLKIRGTISGLDAFPPDPCLDNPSREFFGKKAYEIFRELDERIVNEHIDILAKHWVIFASRDLPGDDIKIPRPHFAADAIEASQGPYDVQFLDYDGPRLVRSGSEFRVQVRFFNRSYRHLSSRDGENPDFISYRWLDAHGAIEVRDGLRTALIKTVGPGEECRSELRILSPARPGKYILAIDLVHEGKTWYSEAGNPSLRIRMSIKKK